MVASAEVKVWTGAGSGWSDATSWNPAGEPAAADTVVFNASASVTPSAAFAGLVSVTSGTLTMTCADDISIALAVADGARFEKAGSGILRAKACPAVEAGFVTGGTIAVGAGTMRFAGNGHSEAPGYFGRLEVAAGATAEVVDSPAEGRHGGLWRTIEFVSQASGEACVGEMFGTYDASSPGAPNLVRIAERWAAAGADVTLSGTGYWRFCDRTLDGVFPFRTESVPADVAAKNYLVLVARGVVIASGQTLDFIGQGWTRYRALFNLNGLLYNTTQTPLAQTVTPAAGWTALDCGIFRYDKSRAIETRLGYRQGTELACETHLGEDTLWNGVCFSSVSLAATAVLAVADDQAVALSGAEESTFAGTVTGGGGSVFALMAGSWSPDWTKFSGFSGTIEVGRLATLPACGVDFGVQPFTLASRGTIVAAAGLAGLTDACTGVISIPAGVTVTTGGALLGSARVKGEGRLVVTGDATADNLNRISAATTLDDGATVTMSVDGLKKTDASVVTDGWTEADGWTLTTNDVGGAEGHPAGVIDGGTLTLVQAPTTQRAMITYTAQKLSADSTLDIGFTQRAINPQYPDYPLPAADTIMAEGWSFVLYDGDPGKLSTDQVSVPDNAFGFSLHYWLASNFRWEVGGVEQTVENIENFKFKRGEDTQVRIGLTNGVMTVTFSQPQNGALRAFSRDISEVFALSESGTCYFGFTATTGGNANYAKMDFRDLACRFTTCDSVRDLSRRASIDVSAANWKLLTDSSVTNGNELNIVDWKDNGTGRCYAKDPVSAFEPFTLEFDMIHDRVQSPNNATWANGWAVGFQDAGDFTTMGYAADGDTPYYGSPIVPKVHNSFMIQRRWYLEKNIICCTAVDQVCATVSKTAANPGGLEIDPKVIGEEGHYHVKLVYDGMGTVQATFSQPNRNHSYTFSQYFSNYARMTDGKMYLTFTSSIGTSASYMTAMRVRNLTFKAMTANGARTAVLPLSVAAGDSATLASSAVIPGSASGLTCSDVSLGAGATLNVATDDDVASAWIGLTLLRSIGASTVAATGGATVELSTVDLTQGTGAAPWCLEVTGAWRARDGRLTVVVPVTWRKIGSFLLLVADPDAYAGPGEDPVFSVVDAAGRPLRGSVVRTAGGYRFVRRGVVLVFQ